MNRKGFRNVPPKAGAMIEALRGLGYSPATALADLVDNSLSAGADRVDLDFQWNGTHSRVVILDNGHGMNDEEVEKAMRLGERNPLDVREATDLGRFGLGLKTASFSQCRRLTVASRRAKEVIACLRWDLDVLLQSGGDEWRLLEGPADGSEQFFEPLIHIEHGTLVLWEQLDRIVTPGFTEQDFLDLIDYVERHLAMVFHRYLDRGQPNFCLTINGRPVKPWDPFLLSNTATWSSPTEGLFYGGSLITVQCHVLPHKDRLDSKEYDLAAGPDGWTAQQGFYVYRNQRLLVAGSWLGLGQGRSWTKEEAHRLARIRLDIPNTADSDWKIDIRKSTAKPPVQVKSRLTKLAEDTRSRARRVFAHRGYVPKKGNDEMFFGWRTEYVEGGMRYRINKEHPAIKTVLDEAGLLLPQIQAMLRVLEETVPVQRIWLDTTEAKETPLTGFAKTSSSEVKAVLEVMYRNLVIQKSWDSATARKHLLQTEPFQNYPELIANLPD